MALSVKYTDKIIAGLHQSYTITSDEGPPEVQVRVDGQELANRIVPLGPPKDAPESTTSTYKYKVSFHLPEDTVGKTLEFAASAGSGKVEDSKDIVEA